jgi:hypothetical protein
VNQQSCNLMTMPEQAGVGWATSPCRHEQERTSRAATWESVRQMAGGKANVGVPEVYVHEMKRHGSECKDAEGGG